MEDSILQIIADIYTSEASLKLGVGVANIQFPGRHIIIDWQKQCDSDGDGIELQLIEPISPITWDNVILYGEYVLDEKMVKL